MAVRFYGEFNSWAHEHKLLSRTQAHNSPADLLRVYGEADIPETEDLYNQGGYDFLKMAASAAHVYGRAIVGSESFVWPTAPYQTTPEKIKLAADELLTAGVNAIVYHGFPYIVPEVTPPGWHPFSGHYGEGNYSSAMNEMNPFWPFLGRLNAYMARMQYLSQIGTNVAAVALYRNDLIHGEQAPPVPKLNQALMDAGYNYDHINAKSLARCSVRDRTLITVGGARYRALVLPGLATIDAGLAEKLASFASAGLPIVFAGEVPDRADGLLDNKRNTQCVQAAMRGLHGESNAHFAADVAGAVSLLSAAVDPDVKFHSRALPFLWKRLGSMNAFFLRNSSDASEHVHAEFKAEGAPELWDPWTGEAGPGKAGACKTATLTSYRRRGNSIEVEFDLQPLASALLVFDPDRQAPSAATKQTVAKLKRSVPVGEGGWKLTATGYLASSKTTTINRDLPTLIDWSLDSELRGFSGRAVYTTTFSVDRTDADSWLVLDLGNVRDVAEVTVNGKAAGTLLLRPYETDITKLVRTGENRLEIVVTNALFNCMAIREPRPFRAGPTENPSGLMSAGLIGPVQFKVMS
jgi:hypothetical protein